MKIAIASNNERTIAQHFGRTKGFVIAEIGGSENVKTHYIPNTFTHHSRSGHGQGQHGHSHRAIVTALGDCEAVISRGMGHRLFIDLENAGIKPYITDKESVSEALNSYMAGDLDDNPEKGCHDHDHGIQH